MRKIVVFSGAGLSAESGIPTFRDLGGLWENYSVEEMASAEGWRKNPQKMLEFYGKLFAEIQECKPNAAHKAIARLARQFDVLCITQNADTLLEKAGVKTVWHLHGELEASKCEWHFSSAPIDAEWHCDYWSKITEPVKWGDRCPKCGKQLRPDVVWFGEGVDMREEELVEIAPEVDVFIGVGTSARVFPAASLLEFFRGVREKYFIDPHPAYEMLNGYTVMQGTAAEKIPELVESICAGN